jgi:hypothetical protein
MLPDLWWYSVYRTQTQSFIDVQYLNSYNPGVIFLLITFVTNQMSISIPSTTTSTLGSPIDDGKRILCGCECREN